MVGTPKRLSRRTGRLIIAGALAVWVVLSFVGFLIGYDASTNNRAVAGGVGVLLAGAAWVVLCWAFALTMRFRLLHRGYDLSPRRDLTEGNRP